jgi:hypothetical protein
VFAGGVAAVDAIAGNRRSDSRGSATTTTTAGPTTTNLLPSLARLVPAARSSPRRHGSPSLCNAAVGPRRGLHGTSTQSQGCSVFHTASRSLTTPSLPSMAPRRMCTRVRTCTMVLYVQT